MSARIRDAAGPYLLATVVAGAASLLVLPVTTRHLGPDDYGLLAVASTVFAVGSTVGTLSASFVLSRHFGELPAAERAGLVATVVAIGVAAALAWVGLVLGALAASSRVRDVLAMTAWEAGLASAAAVGAPVWAVANEVLTLEQRSRWYLGSVAANVTLSIGSTLLALLVFDAGRTSLFIGSAAGAVALAASAVPVLRTGRVLPTRRWLGEVIRSSGPFAAHHLTGQGYLLTERLVLAGAADLRAVGLLAHSQRYSEIGQSAVNAVARSVWPVTLAEARDEHSTFPRTRRSWAAAHVCLAVGGLAAVAAGRPFVSLLTNDRFTPAGDLVPAWIVYLLLQNSARPQNGTAWALGGSGSVGRALVAGNAAGIATLPVAVSLWGIWGALAAAVVRSAAQRIIIVAVARRLRPTPFQDRLTLIAVVLVAAASGVSIGLDLSVVERCAVSAVGVAVFGVIAVRPLRASLSVPNQPNEARA